MEEELPEAISIFVSWLYTGRIALNWEVAPEILWILGDQLRSAAFANEAMHLIFTRYNREYLEAGTAEYVYENTTEGSKLRRFIRDLVLSEGPLRERKHANQVAHAKYKHEWKMLIRRQFDLVVDIALEGSFYSEGSLTRPYPYLWEQHSDYLEPINTRPIEDFLKGKQRQGTR